MYIIKLFIKKKNYKAVTDIESISRTDLSFQVEDHIDFALQKFDIA